MGTRKQTPEGELPPPGLKTTRQDAKDKIEARIKIGESIKNTLIQSQNQLEQAEESRRIWRDYNAQLLGTLFTNQKIAEEYLSRSSRSIYFVGGSNLYKDIEEFREDTQLHLGALTSILERLELFEEGTAPSSLEAPSVLDKLEKLLTRFHRVARRLKLRHASRPTLEIKDEYDVQDLLHSLLLIEFNDVREEEWTPSYAGGSSRVDFLLKNERTVIEVKKTRPGLTDRELGDQLIIDVARYQAVPDCDCLVCFVYDPDDLVRNAPGLKADLTRLSKPGLKVVVEVHPTN